MTTAIHVLRSYKPLSDLFELVRNTPRALFLDSSERSAQGRFSLVGLMPHTTVEQIQGSCYVDGVASPLSFFEQLGACLDDVAAPNITELPLVSGALGYLGYSMGLQTCKVASRHLPRERMPEASFSFYDLLFVEDIANEKLYLCTQGVRMSHDDALAWATELLHKATPMPAPSKHDRRASFDTSFSVDEYRHALDRMVSYMVDGHLYVANMTQQLRSSAPADPYDAYRYLRCHNPAPFSAYLFGRGGDAGADYRICCASMERFLQVRGRRVLTRPIKGTRKRGGTLQEDEALRTDLAENSKDNAELLMIVDLERNDLARACVPGTIIAQPEFTVEDYPTVFHLVATVGGVLAPGKSALDLVQAALPGGSITGAPKIRAMEIIDELERDARGLYTGSIGYFSASGDCDLNIVIRTAVCQNGVAYLGVGGGITVESDFDFEYEETLQKAQAVLEALAINEGETR